MSTVHPQRSSSGDALREKAQRWLTDNRERVAEPGTFNPVDLVAELQIHQAELEMQNDQLREAQNALEQARHRYFTLFDLSPNSYFVFNRVHAIHELNLAAAELLGLERLQARNRPFFLYLADESQAEFHRHLNDVFGKRGKHSADLRIKAPDGMFRDLHFESHLLPGDISGHQLCLSAGFDITARKQAESALRESEERFRILAETLPALVWILDSDHKLQFANRAWIELTGHAANPESHFSWSDLIHPEDLPRLVEAYAPNAGQRRAVALEFRLLSRDKTYRWMLHAATPRNHGNGRFAGYICNAVDITEHKEAAAERLNMERRIQETQRLESLGVLAGGVAHDFNNILASILGNAALGRRIPDLPPEAQRHLEQIEAGARRAADLCKQMLSFAGRSHARMEPLDLNALVEESAHLLGLAISKKAQLLLQLSSTPTPVLGDASELGQVVMNLILNAGEAIGDLPGTVFVSTGIRCVDEAYLSQCYLPPDQAIGDYVFFEVNDTGCGMDADTLSRIFEPFFTTKFLGRGLGLAAVLGIVRRHRGTLRVESQPGCGSTFTVLLPPAPHLPPRAVQSQPAVDPAWRGEGTVLVVDDEASVASVVCRMLELRGFKPVPARDGVEAIARFKADDGSIRCMVIDLAMPNLDGSETIREIRSHRPDLPILVMSGYNDAECRGEFGGTVEFLPKPFTIEDLTGKLRAVLK